MTTDDMTLLRQYAEQQSESAFAELVGRHTNLVYSAALRQVNEPLLAEEITQSVFIILAQKARSLNDKTILPGWLYRAACYVSSSARKQIHRRHQREQEAYMESTLHDAPTDPAWQQLAPLLEEAMLRLGRSDRDALILRFFEGRTLAEVGAALGASEDAAKKRVTRALEKLHHYFQRHGVHSTTAIIADAMTSNSVLAAPPALAGAAAAAALGKVAVTGSYTLPLVKGALKLMAWSNIKIAATAGLCVVLAGGAGVIAVSHADLGPFTGPSAAEIVTKSEQAYATLSTYSDQGITQSTVGKTAVAPNAFSIKLARPDLYRVEWVQDMGFFKQSGAAWSAGAGHFMKMGDRSPEKYDSREMALGSATGVSGGAAGSIPGTFFNENWGPLFGGVAKSAKREKDQTIGGIDCYVLSTTLKPGISRTVWIGKQDTLVHQIETVTSAKSLQAAMSEQAKLLPELAANLKKIAGDVKSTEIHTNIVINQPLAAADFDYQASAPGK